MNPWLVRPEGSTRPPAQFPTAQALADALKDGDLSPSDEVRGPGDRDFRPLDTHPAFAELAADLDTPPPEPEEETHLDMNPLIDVALVLLIFFILTATYTTLTRSLGLPDVPEDQKKLANPSPKDLQDRAVKVSAKMDKDTPIVSLDGRVVPLADLERELTALVKAGARKDGLFDVAKGVPWGVTVKLFEAARGAEVQRVWWAPRAK